MGACRLSKTFGSLVDPSGKLLVSFYLILFVFTILLSNNNLHKNGNYQLE